MKRLLLYIGIILAVVGCQEEVMDKGPLTGIFVNEGELVSMNLNLVTSDFNSLKTRLSEDEENTWDVVWIAQFRTDGTLIPATVKKYENNSSLTHITVSAETDTKLYFITNIQTNPYLKPTAGTDTDYVSDFTEFSDNLYLANSQEDITENDRLIMVGIWEGDIIEASGELRLSLLEVYARRLTSKISIVVNAVQDKLGTNYQFNNIEIIHTQLCAVPNKSTFVPGSKAYLADNDLMDLAVDSLTKIESESSTNSFIYRAPSYYVLENMQGGELDNSSAEDKNKNNLAPKDSQGKDLATYVKVRALIRDGKYDGYADYKIYLGKNSNTNFDIERNHHYTITITIEGVGKASADMRVVNLDDMHALQIQKLNSNAASNRTAETRFAKWDDASWGDLPPGSGVNINDSQDHLKIYSGEPGSGGTWNFQITYATTPVNNSYAWPELSLLISTDNGTTWQDRGLSGSGLPTNARFKLSLGQNRTTYVRTATIKFGLDNYNVRNERKWNVTQYKEPAFNLPLNTFFLAAAGKYALPVRAYDSMEWKYSSGANTTTMKFYGVIGQDGVLHTDPTTIIEGHGAVIFEVSANNSTGHLVMPTVKIESREKDSGEEMAESEVKVFQLASAEKLWSTFTASSGIRAYHYSSDPMFETIVGFAGANIPWAMDILAGEDTDYDTDERKMGTVSATDGKGNTLTIFNKLDRKIGELVEGIADCPPIVTPAAICMAMNENFKDITSVGDSRFQWYLPARYQGLMDVNTGMLRIKGAATGVNASTWTSTVPPLTSSDFLVAHSAYFAGNSVDISGNFRATGYVRCIRDRDLSGEPSDYKTYPLLANIDNNPVVIVKDVVNGVTKGYTHEYMSDGNTTYKIGLPLRFTRYEYPPAYDGLGPIQVREKTLSPKFQVAKNDAIITGTSSEGAWHEAAGWNSSLTDTEETGCQGYVEGPYSDWRLPTELELRIIGLLGAGNTTASDPNVLQHGGKHFTDPAFGFARMNGNYWTGTEYTDGTRANYVNISSVTNAPLSGTANAKKTKYRARCVRDL